MNAISFFRTWLALGLALNLMFASRAANAFFGPLWLWLIVIPMLAYGLVTFSSSLNELKRYVLRAYWRKVGVQAVRVRR